MNNRSGASGCPRTQGTPCDSVAVTVGRIALAQESTIRATEHNDDGLTRGGLFAKGNKRGTPRKKKSSKRGRPFGEGYEDFYTRRQSTPSTRTY